MQKKGFFINEDKKIFRLLNGKIISNNNNKLISFEFDKIDYDLSKFSSKLLNCKNSRIILKKNYKMFYKFDERKSYIDEMFLCEIDKSKKY